MLRPSIRLFSTSSASAKHRGPVKKRSFFDHTAVKVGIPLLGFMLGGYYVLSEFMQTHMELKDKKASSVTQRSFDLDEERRKMLQKLDLDNSYVLSRIPRKEEEEKQTSLATLSTNSKQEKKKKQKYSKS